MSELTLQVGFGIRVARACGISRHRIVLLQPSSQITVSATLAAKGEVRCGPFDLGLSTTGTDDLHSFDFVSPVEELDPESPVESAFFSLVSFVESAFGPSALASR